MVQLRAMPGGAELADALTSTSSRGQFGGAPRIDITVEPGAAHVEELVLAAKETAWIEARLWKDQDGADIDIELLDAKGQLLGKDTGVETGIDGVGALLEHWSETCQSVTLRVSNQGNVAGRVAVIVPQSSRSTCGDPG